MSTDLLPPTDGLLVAEVFHTWQGEGPRLGQRASFVRLGACNLSCPGCDSAFTWDRDRFNLKDELTTRSARDVVREVDEHGTHLTVVTGGEPLLQQHRPGWWPLLDGLLTGERYVDIETNGTLIPKRTKNRLGYIVSPKLATFEPGDARHNPDALKEFGHYARCGWANWKIVCSTPDDVDAAADLAETYGVPADRVWIMPEGVTTEAIATHGVETADRAAAHGFNITTRLHVLLWGTERKR